MSWKVERKHFVGMSSFGEFPAEKKARHGQTDLVGAETRKLLEMLFPDSRDGDFVHGILNRPQKRGNAIGITQDLRDVLSVHLQLGLDDIV